jgi:eukaryotic-like serine/threonine-protein kinase
MKKAIDNGLTLIGVLLVLYGIITNIPGLTAFLQSAQSPIATASPARVASVPAATPIAVTIIAAMPSPTRLATTATPVPPTSTPGPRAGEERVIGGAPMVFVPAGEFTMGSEQLSASQPPHRVQLDAFWIDKYEATNNQYRQCVNAGRCVPPFKDESLTRKPYYSHTQFDNYPVNYVLWKDATSFCNWVGKRLPTEAEWEKSARGTDGRTYPWGNGLDESRYNSVNMPWKPGESSLLFGTGNETVTGPDHMRDLAAVGSYPTGASPYGAMDMAGNVWEWVADWYDSQYYKVSPQVNPKGPATGDSKVERGGIYRSFISRDNSVTRFIDVYT